MIFLKMSSCCKTVYTILGMSISIKQKYLKIVEKSKNNKFTNYANSRF